MPQGVYQALAADGVLHVAEGLRVPSPAQLVGLVAPWLPRALYCDRFRLDELRDTKARHVHLEAGGAALALDNLETVCRGCHIAAHPSGDPERRAWRVYLRGVRYD